MAKTLRVARHILTAPLLGLALGLATPMSNYAWAQEPPPSPAEPPAAGSGDQPNIKLKESPSKAENATAADQGGSFEPISSSNPPPINANVPVDAPERPEFDSDHPDPKRHKNLTLYIGVEYQEKLPFLPGDAKFKGDFKKVTKIAIDRSTNTLRFQAVRTGIANFAIYNSKDQRIYDFTLDCQKSNQAKIAQEIRSLLSDVDGISIKIINNKVVIDGQVLLPRDMNRIISVISEYGGQASNLVTLSPLAQRKIAQAIQEDINDPEITVRAINDKFILEGSVADVSTKDRAQAIAEMYVPDMIKETGEKEGTIVKLKKVFVLNLIVVRKPPPPDPGKTIQLVIHFVELDKNFEKGFKFQFTPTIADNSTVTFANNSQQPGGVVSSITGVVSNLLPKLNWAKQYGHARVLESTSQIVLDGQKAELKQVTRIPYSAVVSSTTGQMGTEFADAGITSQITPQIMGRGDNIRLTMDFSMKSLVGTTNSGPMITNSQMNTVIIVKSGQSAAVGGLISSTNSTDYNKLPQNTATDPIISLYASKQFQRDQSQFVVFITPIIKTSASQGAEKIKEKFKLQN